MVVEKTAALTALQARDKSVEEIESRVKDRLFNAYLKGGDSEEWLACFWKNIAITESERCRTSLKLQN